MSDNKSYKVSVVAWQVSDFCTEAPDPNEAEERARDAWFDGDRTTFKHRYGEIDHVEAEEVTP